MPNLPVNLAAPDVTKAVAGGGASVGTFKKPKIQTVNDLSTEDTNNQLSDLEAVLLHVVSDYKSQITDAQGVTSSRSPGEIRDMQMNNSSPPTLQDLSATRDLLKLVNEHQLTSINLSSVIRLKSLKSKRNVLKTYLDNPDKSTIVIDLSDLKRQDAKFNEVLPTRNGGNPQFNIADSSDEDVQFHNDKQGSVLFQGSNFSY